jgi:hypothetical protein
MHSKNNEQICREQKNKNHIHYKKIIYTHGKDSFPLGKGFVASMLPINPTSKAASGKWGFAGIILSGLMEKVCQEPHLS